MCSEVNIAAPTNNKKLSKSDFLNLTAYTKQLLCVFKRTGSTRHFFSVLTMLYLWVAKFDVKFFLNFQIYNNTISKLEQSDSNKGPHLMPSSEKGISVLANNLNNHSSDKTHIQT